MLIEKDRKYSQNSMYAFKHALKHEILFPRRRQNPDDCTVCVKLSTPHSQFLIIPYITAPCSRSPWCTAASFMGTNRVWCSCFGLWGGIKRGDNRVLCSRGSLIPSSSWSKDPSALSVQSQLWLWSNACQGVCVLDAGRSPLLIHLLLSNNLHGQDRFRSQLIHREPPCARLLHSLRIAPMHFPRWRA